MQKIEKDSYQWLFDSIPNKTEDNKPFLVKHLLPNKYSHYIRIFHSNFLDLDIKDKTALHQPYTKADIAAGRHLYKPKNTKRVRMQELAESYGLTFHNEFSETAFSKVFGGWPKYIIGSQEGNLRTYEVEAIINSIVASGAIDKAQKFYGLWDSISNQTFDFLGFEMKLSEWIESPAIIGWDLVLDNLPTWFWPDDKSFCLCSDEDMTSTYMGCKESLYNLIINCHELETLTTNLEQNVMYNSDTINV